MNGLLNYKDAKAKCRHLKKLTCKGASRQVFLSVLYGTPSRTVYDMYVFTQGRGGGESWTREKGKGTTANSLSPPAEYGLPTGLNTLPPPTLPATHCLFIMYFDTGKGGRGRVELERRLEGQQFTKLGRKYQHDWLYLQSINCDKHLPRLRSPFTGQFF